MSGYWSQRNTGDPQPLSEEEKEQMLSWIIPLEPVFPEVVEKICAISAPDPEYTGFYHNLIKNKFAEKYPTELARLLQHLLLNACQNFHHCETVKEMVQTLMSSNAPQQELRAVGNKLTQLGCQGVSDLFNNNAG